ncbi:MAG TPA: cation acetate symporter [Actinomycetales bacterium]|nr:cation acetate symporter [Actinomycetales bacterium]
MTDSATVVHPLTGGLAVLLVAVATIAVGSIGFRLSRTTSDFYVASRTVSARWNASAIGGEYLSAASFLGIAGLVLAGGVDMLWFPVGYTAGYLVLLVLVAAPLRRSGAYTLPDFAESRLASRPVRLLSSALVVGIGWLYLLPQFQGAGLALRTVTGFSPTVGAALVAGVVVLNVLAGGMRSITFVQAFQYWLKLTAIAVPIVLLLMAWSADGAPDPTEQGLPASQSDVRTTLPARVTLAADVPTTLRIEGRVGPVTPSGANDEPNEDDVTHVNGDVRLAPGERVVVHSGSVVEVPAGQPVPHAEPLSASTGADWARPLSGAGGREHPLYATYSLVLALFFGTMGLPHVLVRFYTNPDGRAARRTTAVVIGLLGAFYLFPPIYGALGRIYTPDLLLTGRADTVVLALPGRLLPDPWGELVSALLVAGAFAAFLSTSSGLVVSVAGVLSQDLLHKDVLRPGHAPVRVGADTSVRRFRIATVLSVLVPLMLSLSTTRVGLADTVGLAFALAASTFCPLLVLGIWWRRLTAPGAIAGLATGGAAASAAVTITMFSGPHDGWAGALLTQPAAWTVPLAFAVMIGVSLLTKGRIPPRVGRIMVRLHAPEGVSVDRRA